jgi:hypothetical protein
MKQLLAALMIGALLFATPVPSIAAKQVTLAWDEPADTPAGSE